MRILPGLYVYVGPSDISGVLAGRLRGDQTMLLPGPRLGVKRRLPGLGVEILLPRLGDRLILLSGLNIVRMLPSKGLEVIIWILLFNLTISRNEIAITMTESEEAVSTVLNEHSIHAFGIFNDEIL